MAPNVGAKLVGIKIRFPVPSSSESERIKREQMNKLMTEFNAQLQTERFGFRNVGTDLIAPQFKEGPDSGPFGSES